MTRIASDHHNFFKRAEREANRYGDDPWVFLRELVQNSRDAGASEIECQTAVRDGMEILTCRDNGEGMTERDFKAYFLRLYASSKESDPGSIGFFGVGFWSTLLFEPEKIRVSSCRKGKALAFEIDPGRTQIQPVAPETVTPGTCITLIRPAALPNAAAFAETVRERLVTFTGFVKPLKNGADLRLFCDGAQVNGAFPAPKQWGKSFKNRHFEGVISFGKTPYVRIFKGGILVRDLVSLNEVIPSRKSQLPDGGWSLHPEILINIDNLQVLMDRQKVYEDPLLHKAVVYSENLLLKQHKRLIRDLFPMNLRNRLFHMAARLAWRPVITALLLIATGFFVAYWLQGRITFSSNVPGPGTSSQTRSLPPEDAQILSVDRALRHWRGSVIDHANRGSVNWDFSFQGPNRYFRIRTLATYSPSEGLGPEPHRRLGDYPKLARAEGDTVTVSMSLSGSGQWETLPLPPAYALDTTSITTNGTGEIVPSYNQFGEPLVRVSQPAKITYRSFPCNDPPTGTGTNQRAIIQWPSEYRNLIDRATTMEPQQAVETVAEFIAGNYLYTRDAAVAERFNDDNRLWIDKLIDAGQGDCDVLNGLLVMLLREVGIHAYLCVGLVGEAGYARSDLHAWTQYYDGQWRVRDISRGLSPSQPEGLAAEEAQSRDPLPSFSPGLASGNTGDAAPLLKLPGLTAIAPWLWVLVVPLGFGLWRLRRTWHRPRVERSRYVVDLFQHYFTSGQSDDSFGLQYRPVFPLLSGKTASLFELQKQADRGSLLGAVHHCKLTPLLPARLPVLDRSAEVVTALLPFLPSITWLDEVDAIAAPTDKQTARPHWKPPSGNWIPISGCTFSRGPTSSPKFTCR